MRFILVLRVSVYRLSTHIFGVEENQVETGSKWGFIRITHEVSRVWVAWFNLKTPGPKP